jgi:hypothetical protein
MMRLEVLGRRLSITNDAAVRLAAGASSALFDE